MATKKRSSRKTTTTTKVTAEQAKRVEVLNFFRRSAEASRLNRPPTAPGPDYGTIAQDIHRAITDKEGFGEWLRETADRVSPGNEFPKDEAIGRRLVSNDPSEKAGAMAFLLVCCHDDILPEFRIMDLKRFGPTPPGGTGVWLYVYGLSSLGVGGKLGLYLSELLREYQKITGGKCSQPTQAEQTGPEGEWSNPATKSRFMKAMGIDSLDKFNAMAKRWGIQGTHKNYILRLDPMPKNYRAKIEKI